MDHVKQLEGLKPDLGGLKEVPELFMAPYFVMSPLLTPTPHYTSIHRCGTDGCQVFSISVITSQHVQKRKTRKVRYNCCMHKWSGLN